MSSEIGELTETRGEVKVEWRIENPAKSKWYGSAILSLSDSCWSLEVNFDDKGEIELHMQRQDFGLPKTLSYTVGFKKPDGEEKIVTEENNFLITPDLEEEMVLTLGVEPIYFSPGVVVFVFSLRSEERLCARVSLLRRLWNISIALKEILKKGENTDVALKVTNEVSIAHRLILEAGFSEFLGEVESEMKEGLTGAVENFEEGTLSNVLAYMYSGVLDELSRRNVRSVYGFAYIYRLKKLQKLCSVFVEKILTITEVCDVIRFADSFEDTRLKEKAMEFFAENSSEILVTREWKDFKKENSDLCIEILEHMMRKKAVLQTKSSLNCNLTPV